MSRNLCFAITLLPILMTARLIAGQLVQANWTPCKYENGTVIPTAAENVELYVSNCTRDQLVCNLVRGTNPKLNITFKAKANAPEIERGILARMWMSALGKYVNIPYGPLWNPCESMLDLNTSSVNCLTTGVQSNHVYNSLSQFEVKEDFPQVSNIGVKVIIRQKIHNRKLSSLRRWDKHPGPLFLCVDLANTAVV